MICRYRYIKTKVYTEKGYCLEALKTKFNIGLEHLKQDLSLIGKIKQIEANFGFDATAHQTTSYLFNVDQGGALGCRKLFIYFLCALWSSVKMLIHRLILLLELNGILKQKIT